MKHSKGTRTVFASEDGKWKFILVDGKTIKVLATNSKFKAGERVDINLYDAGYVIAHYEVKNENGSESFWSIK